MPLGKRFGDVKCPVHRSQPPVNFCTLRHVVANLLSVTLLVPQSDNGFKKVIILGCALANLSVT